MGWLISGVLLFCVVHLLPSLASPLRTRMIDRLGEMKYKGLFAVTITCAIALMVIGWRATPPTIIYVPPDWSYPVTLSLLVLAFYFFACASTRTNLKRFVRHPQLTGAVIWAIAHLLSNGEDRSLVLFSGIGLWALLEIAAINRRDGTWQKPQALPLTAEIKPLIGGFIVLVLVALVHPYLFGVNPIRF